MSPVSLQSLPFAHLNLRRNPFGEMEIAQRAALAVVDVDRFVRWLQQPGRAVQFIGDSGRGKSTHLLAIMRRFPGAGYAHVGENQRPKIPRGNPLLIDELQRLTGRQRRRVFRRAESLAAGTHKDFSRELRSAGFEVETVAVGSELTARRLCEILNRRVEAARRGPGPLPHVRVETARAMLDRFGHDVRAIEWHLYDVFQSLPGVQNV